MAPNAGRGLHSFESFSFVIIALSRFISYQGRRKGKVVSPAGKTWRASNRRSKKHKRHKRIIQRNIQPPKTQIKLLCHYNITNMPHQKIQVKFIRVNPDHHRVLHFKLISQQVKMADLHHAVPLINFLQFGLLNQVIVSLQPSHVYQS